MPDRHHPATFSPGRASTERGCRALAATIDATA
jgi:hypothetical protein